jgi:hypothetical protein
MRAVPAFAVSLTLISIPIAMHASTVALLFNFAAVRKQAHCSSILSFHSYKRHTRVRDGKRHLTKGKENRDSGREGERDLVLDLNFLVRWLIKVKRRGRCREDVLDAIADGIVILHNLGVLAQLLQHLHK